MRTHRTGALALATAITVTLAVPAGAETVALGFAWRAGVDAAVEFSAERLRERGDRKVTRGAQGSYRMVTSAVDDGLLVAFSDFEVRVTTPSEQERQGELQKLMTRLASALPDYVVSPAGKVVRIEGAEALKNNLLGAVDEVKAKLPEPLRARLDQSIRAALTTEQLEASLRTSWERDVGSWIGRELEIGRSYEASTTVSAPMLGGASLPTAVSYRLVERTGCTGGAGSDCVLIELESKVDGADAASMIEALSQRLSAQSGQDVRIERIEIVNRLRLVTEPATLIPHEVRLNRTTEMALAGVPQSNRHSEERITRYTYR